MNSTVLPGGEAPPPHFSKMQLDSFLIQPLANLQCVQEKEKKDQASCGGVDISNTMLTVITLSYRLPITGQLLCPTGVLLALGEEIIIIKWINTSNLSRVLGI